MRNSEVQLINGIRFQDVFFKLGKTLPVVRGEGIHQPVMKFALDRLNQNEWVSEGLGFNI